MDFNRALQQTTHNFENILEIMKLGRKNPEEVESVRNLLLTVDLIIDFYLNRETESLRIIASYFPICNEIAQEICEDFITIKFGFYTNNEWKKSISKKLRCPYLVVPPDVRTTKQKQLLRNNYRYEQQLGKILEETIDDTYNYGKTLVFSEYLANNYAAYIEANKPYNSKTVNKYWYLNKAIQSFSKYNDLCPLSIVPESADDLYEHLTENGSNSHFENIVVFPMRNDGRYSDYCSDIFQKPFFDDFISSGCNLKNVFFFCFSRKPYRLRRLFDFKQRMKERIQINDDDLFDFISFTYEEALMLNGKAPKRHLQIQLGKETNEIQEDYENIIDDITAGLDRYVSRRNDMSLCVSNSSVDKYCSKLIEETEADDNLLREIFNINLSLWNTDASTRVRHFVYHQSVFVVTGNDIPNDSKEMFRSFLISHYEAYNVKFGTFGDLRGYSTGNCYLNDIKQKRILVVSFRNDYTESIFHKYPNSFDPFCINPGQKLLEICNYYFLRQYFAWGKYNYGKALRKILKSDFRDSEMKPVLSLYSRPKKRILEDTREEEMDRNTSRSGQQIRIEYMDGENRSYGRSELIYYKYGDKTNIAPLSDLLNLYDSVDGLSVQPITPLVRAIYKEFIEDVRENDYRSEKMFKEQPSYGLTSDEINSDLQLWKLLLIKKINNLSSQKVYNEIMLHFTERYRISYYSFKKWTDKDYGIPRARRMQKYLIEEYLGIRPPYINLIRRIKERTKNDTETISVNIRHFLSIALMKKPDIAYNALSPEIMDLLDISSPDDIANIMSIVRNRISFEPIKAIYQ